MTELDPAVRRKVLVAIESTRSQPGPLLEVLHAVHDALGYVPAEAVPLIATELNLSRAEVHGVVTFYHHFRTQPAGQRVLRLCRAEACQSMQGRALEAHVKARLGIDFHATTPDGRLTLEPVYCLGNCACSPALMMNDELHGRVSPARFDELLSSWSGKP
jgi:formate dehydrogenase subunit gamma